MNHGSVIEFDGGREQRGFQDTVGQKGKSICNLLKFVVKRTIGMDRWRVNKNFQLGLALLDHRDCRNQIRIS